MFGHQTLQMQEGCEMMSNVKLFLYTKNFVLYKSHMQFRSLHFVNHNEVFSSHGPNVSAGVLT